VAGVREISNGQRQWLDRELNYWAETGFVQLQQARAIRDCYETVAVSGQRKHSRARFVLQGLAAFLIGLAALLVVGYNWQAFHWIAKLALVFGTVAGTHAAALYLRHFTGAQRAAEILFFLGCLFYGAGIGLVAQVFHLDSHYPDGVWWWALGVLPFALCLDTLLLHVLYVGLLALWAGLEVMGFSHLSPWFLWSWWPNGAYSLPLLAAPGLIWAYRRNSAKTVALYVPLLAWWIVLQALAWRLEWQAIYLVGAMGTVFLIIAENHRHGSLLAIPYRALGALMLGGALVPPSFLGFQREVHYWNSYDVSSVQFFAQVVLFVVVLSTLLAFALLLRPLGSTVSQHPLARLQEVLCRQWIPFGLVLVMAGLAFVAFLPDSEILGAVLANVGMIVFALWLVRVGLREERGLLFTSGIIYFLLWTVFRYIDLFGEHGGMLGAALMFFICGGVLFGVARFWGKRKEAQHA
jgi:uncharacterized membrane protein